MVASGGIPLVSEMKRQRMDGEEKISPRLCGGALSLGYISSTWFLCRVRALDIVFGFDRSVETLRKCQKASSRTTRERARSIRACPGAAVLAFLSDISVAHNNINS